MRTVTAIRLLDIRPQIGDRQLVRVSVDFRGNLLLLTSDQPFDYAALTPNRYRIHRVGADHTAVIDLGETVAEYTAAEPFSEGRWLVSGWTKTDPDKRYPDGIYRIFSPDGSLLDGFSGYNPVRLQTTSDGRIWAGYHDQAILDSDHVAAEGPACLDEHGAVLFGYNSWFYREGKALFAQAEHRQDGPEAEDPCGILECYAINVTADGVTWLYYLDVDFPLIEIRENRVAKIWTAMPVPGADAFAVHDHRALFAGSYDEKGTLFLVSLEDRQVESLQAVDESGAPIHFEQQQYDCFGRGERLYLLDEHSVYPVNLIDL